MTILCISCYFKGAAFLEAAKACGCKVILLTSEEFRDSAWPKDAIDEIFFMPGDKDQWDEKLMLEGINGLVRKTKIDKIVALDDFDVERAALLREHLRIGGMGQTRARFFRDKLAMRLLAQESRVPCPDFVAPFHDDDINDFCDRVPAPWVLKPRSQASATGITKFEDRDKLWEVLHDLGDERVHYVLERFVSGDVFHIDGLVKNGEVIFARAHQYMSPPLAVVQGGGLFRTHNLPAELKTSQELVQLNEQVMKAFGMQHSATHTEFLRAHEDGKWYFIETAARVGGAHIAEMVEAATELNLWAEWAKIECLKEGEIYELPVVRDDYAGIIITVARQEWPDLSAYTDDEIVWRLSKKYHVGLILASEKYERVIGLLDDYVERFGQDFV